MPRSSPAEMAELRESAMERDGGCRWPGCIYAIDGFTNPLQMAHIKHRGMGGSKSRNIPENCAWLCERHHDVLDGRTALGTLRWELNELMRYVISIH